MKKIKILLGLALLACSAATLAEDKCTSWGCISTVSTLYTNADGAIYVGTPLDETLANCTSVSGVYFTLNPAAGNAKEMYASVLAAHMSNKKIMLRVKEGHPTCELAYVTLDTSY
jgi:hypothetical protein